MVWWKVSFEENEHIKLDYKLANLFTLVQSFIVLPLNTYLYNWSSQSNGTESDPKKHYKMSEQQPLQK